MLKSKVLVLDIGNSQIHGGVFSWDSAANLNATQERAPKLSLQFRISTKQGNSSDEMGLFLRSVLKENRIDPESIGKIAVCSVVPQMVHSMRNACLKYFEISPFMLQASSKTGLTLQYRNPLEVGADRIANAIAGTTLYPKRNLIIVDLGTATTFCVITRHQEYLGGLILPGLKISMEALEAKTARLPSVEIVRPDELVGRSTVESIQSGLYYSHFYAIQGITREISNRSFEGEKPVVLGTGGFCRLFETEALFDAVIPELVLLGVYEALVLNLNERVG